MYLDKDKKLIPHLGHQRYQVGRVMTGPRWPQPKPAYDDDAYALREMERAIAQEASEAPEVVAEFGRTPMAEERCERDWSAMERDPDPNEELHDRYSRVLGVEGYVW
jgi:hypothetical protein